MKYAIRPIRGGLEEAMQEAKTFDTLEQALDHSLTYWPAIIMGEFVSIDDLTLGSDMVDDERTGWKDCQYIMVPFCDMPIALAILGKVD